MYVCVCDYTVLLLHCLVNIYRTSVDLKGEFNLDIMSQSGYWSYISVNNFHPLVIAFCTLVKKL